MNEYLKMLMEYKRAEAALRRRIGELSEQLKDPMRNMEYECTAKRKSVLEQELYDLLDVIDALYDYAGCGVKEQCRNA